MYVSPDEAGDRAQIVAPARHARYSPVAMRSESSRRQRPPRLPAVAAYSPAAAASLGEAPDNFGQSANLIRQASDSRPGLVALVPARKTRRALAGWA